MPGIRVRIIRLGQSADHATVGECNPEKYCSPRLFIAPRTYELSDTPGGNLSPRLIIKVLSAYNVYTMIMSAVKRIPVSEPVWKKLGEMKGAGQTYDDLLLDMIERVKKARLLEDVKIWESCPDSEYVSLSEIKD